jgi:hypothetical protein
MFIGLLDHRHDDRGDPLPQAPHGKHSQGRAAPKPAQAPQERQLLRNLRVGHHWRHARETPRRRRGCCTLSDREGKPCGTTGDRAGGSAFTQPMYSLVLWAPPGWAIPR